MKSNRISLFILIWGLVIGCGGGGGGSGSSGGGGTPPAPAEDNVLLVTVNGALCSNNSNLNKACVSVNVCTPGTTTCQTIDDIVLDTGSFGLRIFKQALNVPLTQVNISSGSLTECIQYADGSSDWGPVQTANIILGNEPAVEVPIQVIDSTFFSKTALSKCGIPHQSPTDAGYNGILGVGLFAHDCGPDCANSANNGMYYVCNGSNCSGTKVPLDSQVQNPVALLPVDNNGVLVQLPSVPEGGAPSVNGSLVLGIGTQPNNMPTGVIGYTADQFGEFNTTFNNIAYAGIIDTGSNGLFFSTNLLLDCPPPNSGWFCPPSTVSLKATNTGASGSPSGEISFQIGNFNSLLISSNRVFNDVGGSFFDLSFDWGLPFFLGRNIFVGLDGKESSLGTGPYWAY